MPAQPDDSPTQCPVAILEGHRAGSVFPAMALFDDVDAGDWPVILGHDRPN
jgi:hypothetical protein